MKTDVELIQIHQDAEIAVNLPVSGPVPLVNFGATVMGNEARFVNNTQGANLHYWTFGDYMVSNEVSPTHTYLGGGIYTVTLRASSDQSMMGVVTSTMTIHQLYLPIVMKSI